MLSSVQSQLSSVASRVGQDYTEIADLSHFGSSTGGVAGGGEGEAEIQEGRHEKLIGTFGVVQDNNYHCYCV